VCNWLPVNIFFRCLHVTFFHVHDNAFYRSWVDAIEMTQKLLTEDRAGQTRSPRAHFVKFRPR